MFPLSTIDHQNSLILNEAHNIQQKKVTIEILIYNKRKSQLTIEMGI